MALAKREKAELLAALAAVVGEDGLTAAASELARHGQGESYHPSAPPDVVVYPQSTDAVAAIVRVCRVRASPIIPFGAGTSLEGHVAALRGGVCVDLTRMNRIVEI